MPRNCDSPHLECFPHLHQSAGENKWQLVSLNVLHWNRSFGLQKSKQFPREFFFNYKPVLLQKLCNSLNCEIFNDRWCLQWCFLLKKGLRSGDVFTHTDIWQRDVFLAHPRNSLENVNSLMFICKQKNPHFWHRDKNGSYVVLNSLAKWERKEDCFFSVSFYWRNKWETAVPIKGQCRCRWAWFFQCYLDTIFTLSIWKYFIPCHAGQFTKSWGMCELKYVNLILAKTYSQ